ncbi:MAG: 6-pyruvoyl-tetrahydropterin synthase-related protein [Candidatus Curtissbacteria bacterium]
MLELSKIVKFWRSTHFISILALIFLSIFALKSLTVPGFYTSHDGETHTARIAQYAIAISDGQIPPRYANTLYSGLGSPIFVYIYPVPYLLGSAAHALGFTFADSFKLIMALGFICSGIFAYLWLFEFFKSSKPAFLGALFYIWVPYRFSLIYVRGSISELLAYTFLPLALYSYTMLLKRKSLLWVALSALATSLVLLSQNLVAAITMPVLFSYVLLLGILDKSPRYTHLSVSAFVWGAGVASVTYLPALFERKFIRFDEIISKAYPDHFVTLKQLFHSPWGYGFDLPGTLSDQMSFQIGLAHVIVIALASLVIIFQLAKKIFSFRKTDNLGADSRSLYIAIFFTTTFFLSILLMLDGKFTKTIWDDFKILHTIDIPWRLLGICSLASAFLAGFIARSAKSGLVFMILILAVLIANRNHLRINEPVIFSDNHFLNYSGTATQYNEFTPIWRQSTKAPLGIDPNTKVKTTPDVVDITNLLVSSKRISFNANVEAQTAEVRINRFYFPTTEVIVDGKSLKPFSDFSISGSANLSTPDEEDGSGMPLIRLAKGAHHVTVSYKETPLRQAADFLSAISVLTVLGILLKHAKK